MPREAALPAKPVPPSAARGRGGRKLEFSLWAGAILLFAGTVVLVWTKPFSPPPLPGPSPLPLKVMDLNGRMRVEWDSRLPIVMAADDATLEVLDGEATNQYPVEVGVLRSGTFDYLRQSNEVRLTITLRRGRRPIAIGMVRSLGPPADSRRASTIEPAAAKPEARRTPSRSTRRRR